MAEMTQRQRRLSELVRQIVAHAILDSGVDPEVAKHVNISHVRVSKDGRQAKVYFTLLGQADEEAIQVIEMVLNEAAPRLQQRMGKEMQTKFTPRLRFAYDNQQAHAARIDALIRS